MKQITKRLVLLGIVSLALTSCELSFNPFDFSGWGNSNTSSDTSDDTSSNGDNTSSSPPRQMRPFSLFEARKHKGRNAAAGRMRIHTPGVKL